MSMEELKPISVLGFELEEQGYEVTNLLRRSGNGYCSQSNHNVDVVFEFKKPIVLTQILITGPPSSYTAPLKDAAVFITPCKLDRKDLEIYNDMSRDKFDHLQRKGRLSEQFDKDTDSVSEQKDQVTGTSSVTTVNARTGEGKGEGLSKGGASKRLEGSSNSTSRPGKAEIDIQPLAFITLNPYGEKKVEIKPARGRYIWIKFITAWTGAEINEYESEPAELDDDEYGEADNIDVGYCAFTGRYAPLGLTITGSPDIKDIDKDLSKILMKAKATQYMNRLERSGIDVENLLHIFNKKDWRSLEEKIMAKRGHMARIRRVVLQIRRYRIAVLINTMPPAKALAFLEGHPDITSEKIDVSLLDRDAVNAMFRDASAISIASFS
ncbi:hypothetical protein AAMO2058_001092300 [Amorphochlora amoebiformis]